MIDNFDEFEGEGEGDLILVDAEQLDKLILSIGANESDFSENAENCIGGSIFSDLPDGKYYALRAIARFYKHPKSKSSPRMVYYKFKEMS
jgi:hypothetical protein